jgi:sugar phosphate isomerase/epimerase
MCDGEGDMADPDKAERRQAVRNHRKWLDIAGVLGCHSIRCNAGGAKAGDADAVSRCAESFAELVEYARADKLNVIIENHGGLSSDPDSLLAVVKQVNDPLLGTLPDFGNFPPEVDRYDAVRRMMPFAKAVSAKCHAFDEAGNETKTDYARMMQIVLDAEYKGFVGIEYEGPDTDEVAGVRACQRLLERFQ